MNDSVNNYTSASYEYPGGGAGSPNCRPRTSSEMVAPRRTWAQWAPLIVGFASLIFVISVCFVGFYSRLKDALSTEDDKDLYNKFILDHDKSSGSELIVKKVDCPALPDRADLEYSSLSTMLGTKVTFKCKDSYSLIGAQEIICQANGGWSAPLPKCENVECPDMTSLVYTTVTRNGTLKKNETAPPKITIMSREVGGKATFSCAQGYMVEGSIEAVCQTSGEWSSAIPLCKEVECPALPSPKNGYVSYVTGNAPYKPGNLAQFECRKGYIMEGQPIVACQDTGKWSRASNTTKCVKACTYPGTTIGGTISDIKFYYPIGETVVFDCTEGYDLQGARMLHCLDTAKWSTSIPNCTLKAGRETYK